MSICHEITGPCHGKRCHAHADIEVEDDFAWRELVHLRVELDPCAMFQKNPLIQELLPILTVNSTNKGWG